ncbi:unnamed protein product [Amoebophrya sp. A25]|nr:unnamed protein product [Amoebophrya sp. A25]|eukprot:GSA25T00023367001.1
MSMFRLWRNRFVIRHPSKCDPCSRYFSSRTEFPAPRCLTGWSFDDNRDQVSGLVVGNALLDGDYRSSWPHFRASQQLGLANTLAYLKGGFDELPRSVIEPPTSGPHLPETLVYEMIRESRRAAQARFRNVSDSTASQSDEIESSYPKETVFSRMYDMICPLPSSKGVASNANHRMAHVVARAFGSSLEDNDQTISFGEHPVSLALCRRKHPMECKSTKLDRDKRQNRDAPRLLHFSTMALDKQACKDLYGRCVLMWDDVVTWGNTSEAVRNLLLLAGAARVDILSAFSTGPAMNTYVYEVKAGRDSEAVLFGEPDSDAFQKRCVSMVAKSPIDWTPHCLESPTKVWHDDLGKWIESGWPAFVPNNAPF